MASRRRAVRIICLDAQLRILMLRWRAPLDGAVVWEPPGGGIDRFETPLRAARRELAEETGLPGRAVVDRYVMVERDMRWNGVHNVSTEAFYLARFDVPPPLSREGLEDYEVDQLVGHRWVPWDALDTLPDAVEPPGIPAILAALVPEGPWREAGAPAADRGPDPA